MSVPQVLLITHVVEFNRDVGGIYLRDLLTLYPRGRVAIAIVAGHETMEWPEALSGIPHLLVPAPAGRLLRGWNRLLASVAPRHFLRRTSRVWLPKAVQRIADFGRQHGAELVWAPLSTPTMIRIAQPAAAALGLPLHTTVWDPPEFKLARWGIRRRVHAEYLEMFETALRNSTTCAVSSEEMERRYEKRYGIPCVTLRHGIDEARWQPLLDRPHKPDELVIGFSGTLYAQAEFEGLLNALDTVAWRIAGRRVILRLLTREPLPGRSPPARVEYLGWHSVDATLDILSQVDVCYLPYWLDEKYRDWCRVSFPTKLTTYLAAGRPIFFHGPADSAPADFFRRYQAAVSCDSRSAEDILSALESLVATPGRYAEAVQAGRRGLQRELGCAAWRRGFAEFLQLEERELLPCGN